LYNNFVFEIPKSHDKTFRFFVTLTQIPHMLHMTNPEILNDITLFFEAIFKQKLNEDSIELLHKSVSVQVVEAKKHLFVNGDAHTAHYFVVSGLLRMYLIDHQGKTFNILFAKENQVIGDLATPEPTRFNLESIEKSTLYVINNNDIIKLSKLIPSLSAFDHSGLLRRSYIAMQKRMVGILTQTAELNYQNFRKEYPDLIQRLPKYHIASYLGISPEFLSKITSKK